MILMLIGLIVLIVGKFRLTKSFILVGSKARWYGALLVITDIPFSFLLHILVGLVTHKSLLDNTIGMRVITWSAQITYLILLALPFRERAKTEKLKPMLGTASLPEIFAVLFSDRPGQMKRILDVFDRTPVWRPKGSALKALNKACDRRILW